MRFPALAAGLLLCVSSAAIAAPDMSSLEASPMPRPSSPLVQAFVQNAGIGNQFEMTTSQMALERSQDPAVRHFAQTMLNDHHKAELALDRAAAPTGVATHFMFDKAHQAKLDELDALSGQGFDDAFWVLQRAAHAEAVAGIGDYAMSGSDPALVVWARQTLPVVLGHQRMIADMTGTSAVALQ
ncbi:DUF4142 domain-containing protein [Lichenihabitans sp. Uapishka_5]|uniref:DUF4142 domain-containing protein n=1 Tax=Lichenihabitans sp. Uapishka_5 TaxID=3037302 RepID=UPI0029E7F427|nr:DUF4142 domain-containing protein [Lichenihabitans sp. Uapishka_5]MDX7951111.1 DUF4142 domain-containing protein [Lichenihabitans sp. Uapishka_5]